MNISKNKLIEKLSFEWLILFGLVVFVLIVRYTNIIQEPEPRDTNLKYNQIMSATSSPTDTPELLKSQHDGEEIKWQGKISSHYSQLTGIKFCVVDKEHEDVDISKPCDWFWAFSKDVMNADNLEINPGWDGYWVNYILNYYKVPFDKDQLFYDDIYTVAGKVNGLDCGVDDKCVPNIEIQSISK